MSRAQRSILNYITGLGFTGLMLLLSLVATPWLLRWLGQEQLGAFRAAGDWLSYLALVDLGIGGGLMPLVVRHVGGSREDEGLSGVLVAGFRAYRRVTVLTILAGAVVIAIIPRL